MTIGGYDSNMISSDITWNPLVEDYNYWQLKINSITFNGVELFAPNTLLPIECLVDTGFFYIAMPNSHFNVFFPALESALLAITPDLLVFVQYNLPMFEDYCYPKYLEALPSIIFNMSVGNIYSLPPSIYLINSTTVPGNKPGFCFVYIQNTTIGGYSIGDVFMRKFYAVFDSDNLQLGFANNVYNPPTDDDDDSLSTGAFVGIAIALFVFGLIVAGLILYFFCIRKNKQQIE